MDAEKPQRNYLALFIVVTLAWTWTAGFIPLVFGIEDTGVQDLLFKALAGPAPSVVGVILVLATYSKERRRDYFRRCFGFRQMGLKAPLAVMVLYALVCVASVFIGKTFFGGEVPGFEGIRAIAAAPYLVFVYLFFALISGPLNEEFAGAALRLTRS